MTGLRHVGFPRDRPPVAIESFYPAPASFIRPCPLGDGGRFFDMVPYNLMRAMPGGDLCPREPKARRLKPRIH